MSRQYLPTNHPMSQNRNELICKYFYLGFKYNEIIAFLNFHHNIDLSLRQLKRILSKQHLYRRVNKDNLPLVYETLRQEIHHVGENVGYRLMHDRLRKLHKIVTDRETVRYLMHIIDPHGVEQRKKHRLTKRQYYAQRPNFVWHIDGWDKLKPYGLSVHGCIDGYSRRIMWLEANASNKDPYAVCRYFANCVKSIQGLPNIVRGDRGTENVNIEIMQLVLRNSNSDVSGLHSSFLYGKSIANQRIEGWWSKFKQAGMNAWIGHFKDLVNSGILDTSSQVDIQCVRFCYMNLLRLELADVMMLWNTHHIRKSREGISPNGKPDILYHFPEVFGGKNCQKQLNNTDLETIYEILTTALPDCDLEHKALFDLLMEEGNKTQPYTIDEAAELLAYILDAIECIT